MARPRPLGRGMGRGGCVGSIAPARTLAIACALSLPRELAVPARHVLRIRPLHHGRPSWQEEAPWQVREFLASREPTEVNL
jgi:hypothetical protein